MGASPFPMEIRGNQPASCMWVDVPSGWMNGFPKKYCQADDGELVDWLKENGYTDNPAWVRMWYEET